MLIVVGGKSILIDQHGMHACCRCTSRLNNLRHMSHHASPSSCSHQAAGLRVHTLIGMQWRAQGARSVPPTSSGSGRGPVPSNSLLVPLAKAESP